jgi:mannose-6-phosphate isomerase
MLYPLKFRPIYKEKIWGGQKLNTILNKDLPLDKKIGESWEISAVEDNISVVENGFLAGNALNELVEIYMGDLLGDKVYEKYGIEFPILIKFIDANDDLSIQVHPDDKLAKERHQAYGKNEMWFIMQAEENAGLYFGFSTGINKDNYLNVSNIKDFIYKEELEPRNIYEICAGRVHSIGKGVLLAEIQQTSDITYRIYDWDRTDEKGETRELHKELALDAIHFELAPIKPISYSRETNEINEINRTPNFSTNYMQISKAITRDYAALDSFVIFMAVSGEGIISDENNYHIELKKGETLLIPAELSMIKIETSGLELLEIFL